jgi:sulfite exporter TauE/SafE
LILTKHGHSQHNCLTEKTDLRRFLMVSAAAVTVLATLVAPAEAGVETGEHWLERWDGNDWRVAR